MSTIKGYCHTDLDGYERVEWPTEFVSVPRAREFVQGRLGDREVRVLRVVSVTHYMTSPFVAGRDGQPEPSIRVELHR